MNNNNQADILIAAQCRNLYLGLPGALVANGLLALLLVVIQIEVIAPALCFAWLACLAVVLVGRGLLLAAWRRTAAACRAGDRRWLGRFRVGTLATAAMWGGAGQILFPAADPIHQLFLAFVLAGVGACATSVLAIDRVSTYGFLALMFIPLMLRFLLQGGPISLVMSSMLGLFWLFIDTNSRRMARSLFENCQLKSEADLREQSLVRSERNLQQAQHLAHLGSYDWDVPAQRMACSTEYFHCLGLDPAFTAPCPELIRQVIHPDDFAAMEQTRLRALSEGGPFECVYRVVWPDGSEHYLRERSEVIRDASGQAIQMFGTIQDITKPRLALNALQASEARFRAVFESAHDAIITSNDAGIIIQWNQGAEQIFGYTAQEVLGQPIDCLIPEPHRAAHRAGFSRAVAGGRLFLKGKPVELCGRRQNGAEFPLELSLSRWEVGEGQFFSSVIRDISERQRIERELAAHRAGLESLVAARTQALTSALELAETANRAKSVFLANMGHELRTPLNAVIGFSRMLIRGNALNEDGLRKLEIIHRSGNHLLDLINSVLELARIEAGRVHLQEESGPIEALLKELAAGYQGKAEKAGLQFVLATPGSLPAVRVDAGKLRQVLINLLDNAIKFTRHGRVELSVRAGRPIGTLSAPLLRLEFAVSDTGIGVSPDDLPRIFEPFVQLDADPTSAGTGLGLSITRQYLLMMGGQLAAKSTIGHGSAFSFSLDLPLAEMPLGELAQASAEPVCPDAVPSASAAIGAADLAALPESLRSALCDAVSELNPGKIRRVLAQFESEQPQLAQGIAALVEALRYQELCDLLTVKA